MLISTNTAYEILSKIAPELMNNSPGHFLRNYEDDKLTIIEIVDENVIEFTTYEYATVTRFTVRVDHNEHTVEVVSFLLDRNGLYHAYRSRNYKPMQESTEFKCLCNERLLLYLHMLSSKKSNFEKGVIEY